MIEVNTRPIGAKINGVFYKLPPRLAEALERLVRAKGLAITELIPGKDRNSQKVCAHDLRHAIHGTGYTIISNEGGYLLVSDQSLRKAILTAMEEQKC